MNVIYSEALPELALNAGILECHIEQQVELVADKASSAARRAALAALRGGVIRVSDIGNLINYLTDVLEDESNYR